MRVPQSKGCLTLSVSVESKGIRAPRRLVAIEYATFLRSSVSLNFSVGSQLFQTGYPDDGTLKILAGIPFHPSPPSVQIGAWMAEEDDAKWGCPTFGQTTVKPVINRG